jgi:hypothetical protein
MHAASSIRYGPVNLTIVEMGEGKDAWVFLPFETGTATVHVFDGRYVYAYDNRRDWALFDGETRRRVTGSAGGTGFAYIFCYSPRHRALFIAGRRPEARGINRIHEVPVDGSPARVHDLPDGSHVVNLIARDDGAIVGLSNGAEGMQRIILDPGDGAVRTDWLRDIRYAVEREHYGPRWASPDGRWALRDPAAGLPSVPGYRHGLIDRFMPRSRSVPNHPDLRPDGETRYALALDLIELDPLRHAATLVIAYRTAGELNARLDDVIWDPDSKGFSVQVDRTELLYGMGPDRSTLYRRLRRHVSLDGIVGPLELVDGGKPGGGLPEVSARAHAFANALVKERSTQVVPLPGTSVAELRAAIEEMTRHIAAHELGEISFGGVLRFRFRSGRKLLNEKKMFELVRAVPAAEAPPLVEALRDLLTVYGDAARRHAAERPWENLKSGSGDHDPAALSQAALSLASMDEASAAALRGWFETIDMEHDEFAAEKVFRAYFERTRFRRADALRFGLWFLLRWEQTVSFEDDWLGLFDIASETVAPELFARLAHEEARSLAAASPDADRLADYVDRLIWEIGESPWGLAVADQLRRL